jgi:hypothetical protein
MKVVVKVRVAKKKNYMAEERLPPKIELGVMLKVLGR